MPIDASILLVVVSYTSLSTSEKQAMGSLIYRALRLVGNVGVEHFGVSGHGNEVVIGRNGRDHATEPLVQQDFIARCSDAYFAVAGEAHGDDKAVMLGEIAVERH